MTLRVVVQDADRAAAANVGGPVDTSLKTFDIESPELEQYLQQPIKDKWNYVHRQVIGVEVIVKP